MKNLETTRNTQDQADWYAELNTFIDNASWSALDKLSHFSVFTPRQFITRFIEAYEFYRLVRNVPGCILECGVGSGSFLMSMAHCCAIHEPYHYTRRLIGFDTFSGFTPPSTEDQSSGAAHMKTGGLDWDSYEVLLKSIEFYDRNRALGHIQKVQLVKGDISQTLPVFLEENPCIIVGMLHLDLDLYRPTKDAIELLRDRIPRGGVIVFDEPNHADYPGETIAMMETLGLQNIELKRLEVSSMAAYAVM